MAPEVTIAITTCNRRPLLARALGSALAQTERATEIIVVDDASEDDTPEFMRDRQSDRVRYLRLDERSGAQRARNLALAEARGEFFTGLDDDDEFTPVRVESFLAAWRKLARESQRFSSLFTESANDDGCSRQIWQHNMPLVHAADLLRHNFVGSQVFTRTHFLREIGGFDEHFPAWQDFDTFYRLLSAFGAAVRIEPASYVCYTEPGRDRISTGESRVRKAFDLFVDKHQLSSSERSQLFGQMFSPFYGISPIAADWMRAVGWGCSSRLLGRLAKAKARSFLRRDRRPKRQPESPEI